MNKNKLYEQILKDREKNKEKKIGTVNVNELKNKYNNDINKYWENRTNEPYKNIIKDQDYKKKIINTSDLIVHKVTPQDKIGVDNDFVKLQHEIDEQNNYIKNFYSVSKKQEHQNLFEYNHKYKFRPTAIPNSSEELKNSGNEYYQMENKNIELEKKRANDLLQSINFLNNENNINYSNNPNTNSNMVSNNQNTNSNMVGNIKKGVKTIM